LIDGSAPATSSGKRRCNASASVTTALALAREQEQAMLGAERPETVLFADRANIG